MPTSISIFVVSWWSVHFTDIPRKLTSNCQILCKWPTSNYFIIPYDFWISNEIHQINDLLFYYPLKVSYHEEKSLTLSSNQWPLDYWIQCSSYDIELIRQATIGIELGLHRVVALFLTRFSTKTGYCNAKVSRQSTFGFRSITLVWFGLLTPNLVYG